ncbi:EboA domain-containing protein [Streptomyces sp. DT2A-34]|uniref:EboA domain-containing protein n=1 Tax=Streptomyces sp. DT2A-34 TaxID=3051182 RepID=UPI00265C4C38|nr:EboA domain-containing protein [Streptomyces sp. DT2A-34]MDO0910449.1 EboA domain-containing protein [Streptomyces sp. DT2A-34]
MAVTTASPSAPPDPHRALIAVLDGTASTWLDASVAKIAADPAAVRRLFPAARRRCGHGRLDGYWAVDEAARAVLLTALPLRGQALADEVTRLHRHGDPAEQRAVLRTLPLLDLDDLALPLVRESLRGNDTTLIEAALGPYAAAHLPDAEHRQAVLKCVFYEIPLDRVTGLDARADRELARMLADFASERIVAGRDVPQDILPVVRAFPDVAGAELEHAPTGRSTDPLTDVLKEEG